MTFEVKNNFEKGEKTEKNTITKEEAKNIAKKFNKGKKEIKKETKENWQTIATEKIYEKFQIEKSNDSLSVLGIKLNKNAKNCLYINSTLEEAIVNFLKDYDQNIAKKDKFDNIYLSFFSNYKIGGKKYDNLFEGLYNEWVKDLQDDFRENEIARLKKSNNKEAKKELFDLENENSYRWYISQHSKADKIIGKAIESNIKEIRNFLNKVIETKYT